MRMMTTLRHAPHQRRGISPRWSLCAAIAWAGAALATVGCSEGYDIPARPADAELLQGDADCLADNEPSQGDACTEDCLTATCASGTGRRICTCEGGVFLQCACLPPESWPFEDVPAAPYCDNLTGQPKYLSGERCASEGQQCISGEFPEQGCNCVANTWQCNTSEGIDPGAPKCESFGIGLLAVLKDQPCDNEWQLCISRDYNATGTSPRGCVCQMEGAALFWTCGPTNRWWRAE